MSNPKLTIGIPTYTRSVERPELLQQAIRTAIGQTIPARVLVSDQGDNPETREVCREWADHPLFRRVVSPAKTLWQNWRHAAEVAAEDGASFFSWLQDDDGLCEKFASRVCRAFGYFPDAGAYCSNLAIAYDNCLGFLHVRNFGPKVPVDVVHGRPAEWPGALLVILGYFDSWCMSPAKAFRVDAQFLGMLRDLPDDCDCFTERLDVAGACVGRRFVADPKQAGYWNIHGKNESQITGEKQSGQVAPAYAYLDTLMDRVPEWRNELAGWMTTLGTPSLIETYYRGVLQHRDKSPYAAQILDYFEDVLSQSGVNVAKIQAEVESVGVAA